MTGPDTLQYILKKFNLTFIGCLCGHLPSQHENEVKRCLICLGPTCERYNRHEPLEIVNFGRNQLPALFQELGYKTGAEIGVMKGEYAQVICEGAPDIHLFCIDPWQAYKGYDMGDQAKMDEFFAKAQKRLRPYPNKTFIREFSVKAAKRFPDNSLDFIYIDAAHDFVNVVNDLNAWTPKVRRGGAICGHDYVMRGMGPTIYGKANMTFHVKQAVDAWTLAFLIDPFFVLGRKEPREGEIRDKIRSFLWVKE